MAPLSIQSHLCSVYISDMFFTCLILEIIKSVDELYAQKWENLWSISGGRVCVLHILTSSRAVIKHLDLYNSNIELSETISFRKCQLSRDAC